jgi:serine protease Do
MNIRTILLSLLSAAVGGWVVLQFQPAHSVAVPDAPPMPVMEALHPAPAESVPVASPRPAPAALPAEGFNAAADAALDAVVHIRTAQTMATNGGWGQFFGMPGSAQIQRGSGSGVILSEAGLIVTNHHVIDGAGAIEVGLNDNRSFEAELVGSDPATDIAVLRIEANGLTALPWGNSDDVRIGDWVLAVGNPFDLTSTVTAGIVSAKARDIQLLRPDYARDVFPVESFIQTDAAVNPGNSGGALVDTRGQLVGINTAIASRTGSYAGYSFAVPANLAAKVARDLIEFGQVQRAFLGVTIRPVNEAMAEEAGLPGVEGVMVTGLTEDGGAAEAGLREGDVILSVDGDDTPTLPLLLERVNRHRPGERTDIEVWRNGRSQGFTVELKDRFGRTELNAAEESRRETLYGAILENDADKEGVLVVESGTGALGRTGVPPGTLIQTVDGAPIASTADLMAAIEQAQEAGRKAVLIEGLTPDGRPAWFGMGVR